MILLSRILCSLPVSLCDYIGKLLGEFMWLIVPGKRKKMAVENIVCSLQIVETQALSIAKQSTTRFGAMLVEVLRYPLLNKTSIKQHVIIKGQENLIEALACGKGALLVSSHSGNWELIGTALVLNGFSGAGVVQKQTNNGIDRFINEYRTKCGMDIRYKSSVREMMRLLGEGKVIGLLMDQHAGKAGVEVDFFGRPASTPTGAAALGRVMDAPVVPAFITKNASGVHQLVIHKPLWVEKTANRDKDVFMLTEKITQIIEEHVRQFPQEWFWLHDRWKH